MTYRVYRAPDGCDVAYCGDFDTYEEAVAAAEREPHGLERCMWDTARAAGHVAGLEAPDAAEESEPISWHGAEGWHCVVKIEAEDAETADEPKSYILTLTDDQGCSHKVEIEAVDAETAIAEASERAQDEAEDWCSNGDWGTDGAAVDIRWMLTDETEEELDHGMVTVEIEPDHETLIAAAVPEWDRGGDFCGLSPGDHDWTSEGEGGCDENPGVWSTGGTSMVFRSHCRRCGLRRTEYHTGSQRNPGECDTVEYELGDDHDE